MFTESDEIEPCRNCDRRTCRRCIDLLGPPECAVCDREAAHRLGSDYFCAACWVEDGASAASGPAVAA